MIEIALYRESLDPASAEALNESLVRFSADTEDVFRTEFPELEASVFRSSRLWLALVGSGVCKNLSASVPSEVELWLEGRITGFFRSL